MELHASGSLFWSTQTFGAVRQSAAQWPDSLMYFVCQPLAVLWRLVWSS